MRVFIVILILMSFFSFTLANDRVDFGGLTGWQPQDSALTYNPKTLWEYINGAADLFLNFGFQQLQSQDISNGKIGATVDIYDMGTALNAYGVYMTERAPNSNSLEIGAEAAVIPPYQCLMLKDRYYVKINIYEDQITAQSGKSLLQAIAEIIPGNNNMPKEFDLLPDTNIIPKSHGYVLEGYQGLSELQNCVFAEYQDSLSVYQVFIITLNIDEAWQKLQKKWKTLDDEESPILLRKIPYKGYVGAILKEASIVGISGLQTKDEIKELLSSLR